MIEFQLFRISVKYNPQIDLFTPEYPKPKQLLTELLNKNLSYEAATKFNWHVGNVTKIDSNSFYFRFGKTTTSSVEQYEDGNFVDIDFEISPYTHIFLDTNLEVCAIAQKSKVAHTQKGIAFRFRDLLNFSPVSPKRICTFEISELSDPQDFIDHLKSAYSIKKFWVKIPQPNAWDVDKDFTKPLQKMIREINAVNTKTEFVGEDLDADKLENISRTAASLGEEAAARIQKKPNTATITKRLRGAKLTIEITENEIEEKKKNIVEKVRNNYKKIKRSNRD